MSELEFLEQKIEAKLDKINEQLSALFQLSTKFLRDSMDLTIEIDNIKKELRDRAGGEVMNSENITDLYDRIFEIEKLETQEKLMEGLQDKPINE